MPSGPGNTAVMIMGRRVFTGFTLLLLMLLPLSQALSANVQTQLSASTISIDESVTLTVLASGLDGELDTSALEKDFDVIGRSSSQRVDNLNGEITNTRNWVLELMPKRTGLFTVPPVSVNGVESQLLTLTVSEAPTGADRKLFVEAAVDQEAPWVQSQVILTLRVFQAVSILDGSLGEPEANDLIVRPLGEDRRFSAERDGRPYDVLERRFALFPQASGRLEIAPITLIASVPSDPNRVQGFFPDTRRLTRRTRPLVLDVQARPPGGTGWWLPAQDVILESRWAESVQEARVDQPLTREIQLQAKGVSDAQLPTIQTPIVDGAGIYADDPVRGTQADAEGLSATQRVTWAVIPQRVGTLTLPAMTIDWFDTVTGQTRTATLSEEIIEVKPALGTESASSSNAGTGAALTESSADQPAQERARDNSNTTSLTEGSSIPNADTSEDREQSTLVAMDAAGVDGNGFWRWLAAAALLGWGITGLLLYRARRRSRYVSRAQGDSLRSVDSPSIASLDGVRHASVAGSAKALSDAVLAWARSQWQRDPPLSLTEVSRRLNSVEASDALRELDAALYRPSQLGSHTRDANDGSEQELAPHLADLLEHAVAGRLPEPKRPDPRQHLPEL